MTVSSKTAKKLLYDYMFESESAKEWVEDVWGLSPFLGQGAANAAEVLGALLETSTEEQLNALVSSLHAAHQDTISELATASEWRVSIDPKTANMEEN
ncbi:MAG: hypothetical protein AAFO06_12045 [Cyanobacteria bacterium J06597_16]